MIDLTQTKKSPNLGSFFVFYVKINYLLHSEIESLFNLM